MSDPDTRIRALLDELADEARPDPALERSTLRRARRRRVAGSIGIVAVVMGIAAGGLVAARDLRPRSAPAVHTTPSPTANPTPPTGPSPTGTPSPGSPAAAVFATDLADERYPAYLKAVDTGTDPDSIRFDLVIWLTGDAANRYAAAHGMETPVPNDNLIVNENPKLRLMPIVPDARIEVIDRYSICGLDCPKPVDLDTFAGFLRLRLDQITNYSGRWGLYWLRIRGGTIVRIDEQFVP